MLWRWNQMSCCLGFVIVDESTSTDRVVHKSLQDYFKIQYDKGTIFTDGHNHVAHICLTYMSDDSYDKEVLTLRNKIFEKYALLKHAISSWAYRSRNLKQSEETEDMACLLHEKFESRLFFRMLLSWYETPQATELWDHFSNRMLFEGALEQAIEEARTKSSLVHVAVAWGMEGLLHRALAVPKEDINMRDWCYQDIHANVNSCSMGK